LAALAGVFALGHHGTNIMGWYANYIIPAGALLVGMACASGYAIAGWFTGLKMTRRLVWSIVGQLVLSYFIAEYEEYRQMVPDGSIGFLAWFDLMTRAFSFAHHDGTPGSSFGLAGYLMRGLEIAGFIAGGVIVPLGLGAKPYCHECRCYMRTKPVGAFRGGWPGDGGHAHMQMVFDHATKRERAELAPSSRSSSPSGAIPSKTSSTIAGCGSTSCAARAAPAATWPPYAATATARTSTWSRPRDIRSRARPCARCLASRVAPVGRARPGLSPGSRARCSSARCSRRPTS
jgi:hypothetical protein